MVKKRGSKTSKSPTLKALSKKEGELSVRYDKKLEQLKAREHEHRESVQKSEHTLKVLESILKEREELLAAQEGKVVHLHKDYKAKLAQLEKKEAAIKERERAIREARKTESAARGLEREKQHLQKEIAKQKKILEGLHNEEGNVRARLAKSSSSAQKLQAQAERAQKRAEELQERVALLGKELAATEEKLQSKGKALADIEKDLTYHSVQEIKVTTRRALDHLEKGQVARARLEYDHIRTLYTHLPAKEKKKAYHDIAKVRERLTHNF